MTRKIFDKVTVKIRALRPVLVGSGRKGSVSLDIVTVGGKRYYVYPEAFIDQYLKQQPAAQVAHLLRCDFGKLAQHELKLALERGCVPTWAQRIDTPLYGTDIHFQLCHPLDGYPVLPGSSVKGALRTILMRMLGEKELKKPAKSRNVGVQLKKTRTDYLEYVKGGINIKEDPADKYVSRFERALTRHLRIPDVVLGEKPEWWNVKIVGDVDKQQLKWKDNKNNSYNEELDENEFVSVVTTIPEGATQTCEWGLELEVRLKDGKRRSAFRKSRHWEESPYKTCSGHPTDAYSFYKQLFEYTCRYMRHYLVEEMRFFGWRAWRGLAEDDLIAHIRNAYDADKWPYEEYDWQITMLEDLYALYRELVHIMEQGGAPACLLRLGWGSGFHAMTGDWQYTSHLNPLQHSGKVKMKTRKVFFKKDETAEYPWIFALPGFVKVELCNNV